MFPIPTGARFISPSGSDAAAGTEREPWRTVTHAVKVAASGSTLVLRGGSYRETVTIPATKRLTLQAFPGEAPWFIGSVPVSGWVSDGGDWRHEGWVANLNRSPVNSVLLDPAFPMAGHPDMTFIDGRPLRQVASRAAVVPGTFFVDVGAKRLWVGSNPSGHLVEGTVRVEALNVMSAGSTVRGIGFKHFGTSIDRNGTVKVSGDKSVVEHCVFQHNASAGIGVSGHDVVVRNITSAGNGQLGVHGSGGHRLILQDSRVSGNNIERFLPTSAAGGVKLVYSTGTQIRRNIVEDNLGHGIWLDLSSNKGVILRNIARRNIGGAGIMFEISDGAIIAGNVSSNNHGGIEAGDSSNVDIWNNTLVDNIFSVHVYNGYRSPVPYRITVRNNIMSAASPSPRPMFMNEDFTNQMSWQQMRLTTDHNAYYRRSSTGTRYIASLSYAPNGKRLFERLPEVTRSTMLEAHSLIAQDTSTNPFVVSSSTGDYRLPGTSPAKGRGAPLPLNVAMYLEKTAGVPVDIGAI